MGMGVLGEQLGTEVDPDLDINKHVRLGGDRANQWK